MGYTPKTEQQLASEGLLPEGIYDFEIVDTDDKQSKKGNDMYTLTLNVFDADGGTKQIRDYIALGSNFGERKLRHAADACGLIEIYNTGNLKPSDFQDRAGKVQIKQQDGSMDFPLSKNVVADYVVKPVSETVATGALLGGDECPF